MAGDLPTLHWARFQQLAAPVIAERSQDQGFAFVEATDLVLRQHNLGALMMQVQLLAGHP
jgi:hypothetical protein